MERAAQQGVRVGMRLRLDLEGQAVRPEEVAAAVNPTWTVLRVHRTARPQARCVSSA